MMIALGKVPTLLSTVINITISAGWVKKGQKQFHAKAQSRTQSSQRLGSPFASVRLTLRLCVKYSFLFQLFSEFANGRDGLLTSIVLTNISRS